MNYLGDDEPGDPAVAAYGPNYGRLQEIKTKYDPTNFFHMNQNIRPLPQGQSLIDNAVFGLLAGVITPAQFSEALGYGKRINDASTNITPFSHMLERRMRIKEILVQGTAHDGNLIFKLDGPDPALSLSPFVNPKRVRREPSQDMDGTHVQAWGFCDPADAKRYDILGCVLMVDHLPLSEHPDLRAAALQTGLLGPDMVGVYLASIVQVGYSNSPFETQESRLRRKKKAEHLVG